MNVGIQEPAAISAPGVAVKAELRPDWEKTLSKEALAFVAKLERRFGGTRRKLLAAREERQGRLDRGELPGFLPETEDIRRGTWRVPPPPADLDRSPRRDHRAGRPQDGDQRAELAAPTCSWRISRIRLPRHGRTCWMARSTSATRSPAPSPTARAASPTSSRIRSATLVVRPRGWHLEEAHVYVDGAPMSGSLFDFGLYFFHNARALLDKGSGPYFYLPKMESHLEAKLWAEVFTEAEETLGHPARLGPRHGADRDHPRSLRNG